MSKRRRLRRRVRQSNKCEIGLVGGLDNLVTGLLAHTSPH